MDSFKEYIELDEGWKKAAATGALGLLGGISGGLAYNTYKSTGTRPADNPSYFIQKSKEIGTPDFIDLDNKSKKDFKHDSDKDYIRRFWAGIKPKNKLEEVKFNNFFHFWYMDVKEGLLAQTDAWIRTLNVEYDQDISKEIFRKNFGNQRLPRMRIDNLDKNVAGVYYDVNKTVTIGNTPADPNEVLGHELNHARHGLGISGSFTLKYPTEIMANTYSFLHIIFTIERSIKDDNKKVFRNFNIRFPSGVVVKVGYFLDNAKDAGFLSPAGYSLAMSSPQGIEFFRKIIYGNR